MKPKTGQDTRVIPALLVGRRWLVTVGVVKPVTINAFFAGTWIDDPILAHAHVLVFEKLIDAITCSAFVRYHLDDEIGGPC